jgi:hypothetical protein
VEGSSSGIQRTIAELKARMDGLDEEIAKLSELSQEREALRQAIFALENVIGKTPADSAQMPVWQHTQEILASNANVPMTAGEIVDALIARGVTLDSKNPSESVRTTLIRKPDIFELMDGGKFRLKVYYQPSTYNLGRRKRQSSGNSMAEGLESLKSQDKE